MKNNSMTEVLNETYSSHQQKSVDLPEITDNDGSSIETQQPSNSKMFETEVIWPLVVGFIILYYFTFNAFYIAFFFRVKFLTTIYTFTLYVTLGLSITMGAHRYFSHKSYKVKKSVKILFLLGHTASGQNTLWNWVRDHRMHHMYCDTDADPHNSRRGFFFSHVGWLMMKAHPEVYRKRKTVDMSDLEADPLIMFQKRHYLKLYLVLGFLIPFSVPLLVWGETLFYSFAAIMGGYGISLNVTFCVNSVAHFFGTKPYTKEISAVDSKFVIAFNVGEGWHNYHHTFPWDYRAQEYNLPFSLSTKLINWLESVGLAYDLKCATPEMVERRILSKGDGSHPMVAKLKQLDNKDQ